MKIYQLFTFGFFLGLYSCGNHTNDFHFPIVQDTIKIDRIELTRDWFQIGSYSPLYIGRWQECICISCESNWQQKQVIGAEHSPYKSPDSLDIGLYVDTTQIISDCHVIWTAARNMKDTIAIKSFPVFIVNRTKDTLTIGYNNGYINQLYLNMEAMDDKGIWRPIEERNVSPCGFGLKPVILPPDEIVLTTVPLFKGTFNTKLRLRYLNMLSQAFYGTINPTQFENQRVEISPK